MPEPASEAPLKVDGTALVPAPSPPAGLAQFCRRLAEPASALLLLLYDLYFVRAIFRARFSGDDMMNMDYYFHLAPSRMALIQWMPWRGYYRPMGGLFYMPLFAIAGLNPAPYHFLALLLLAVNAYLTYRVAMLLGCSRLPAGLAALVMCYHGGMPMLYYDTGYVYDILCGFFYLSAVKYYVRIRGTSVGPGRLLSLRETAILLLLALCALNAKEMAVTLPVVLLAYECIYHPPRLFSARELPHWLAGPARVPVLAMVLALATIYGILFGAGALARQPGYRMQLSLARVADFQRSALGDLLFLHGLPVAAMVAIWLAVTFLAWKRPALRLCWVLMAVGPLPVEFLKYRGGPCLYIPLIGWAIFVASLLVDAARGLASLVERIPRAGPFARRPVVALVVVAAVTVWWRHNLPYRNSYNPHALAGMGADISPVIDQLSALDLHPLPGRTVVFLDDPLHTFDMAHIAQLFFHDRTLTIWQQSAAPRTPQELTRADYVITYRDAHFVVSTP